jgi:RND family efflux transporter MFP subunit
VCGRSGALPLRNACLWRFPSLWRPLSILFLLIVFLLIANGPNVTGQDLAAVVVTRVIEAQVNASRRVVGTVNPLRSSTIGSAVDGRVVEFLINRGDPVKKNQPLARLRAETLEIELAAAEAELNLFEHQLAELENGSRSEDIDEARARMLGAQAAMKNASSRLKRLESLFGSRATAEADVEDARERAEFTRYVVSAAEALLKRIEAGPRVEQIAQAEARVELQRQKARLIEDRIKKHTVVAPFEGFVAMEFTEVGAWVTRGDPIAQVVQLDEVEIEAPTTAEYAVQLRRGDSIRIEFPELPGQLFTGKFARVVPVAAARSRTFPIYIRMTNPIRDGVPLLMAGMLARVELPTGQRQTMPLVTKDALVLNEKDRAVFVVDPDSPSPPTEQTQTGTNPTGTARRVPVELGVAAGGLIQIRGAVRAGDLVVTVGNERLRDGDRVAILRVIENDVSALESVLHSAAAN